MSKRNATDWLLSQKSFNLSDSKIPSNLFMDNQKLFSKAITISITSGKGGVGKTSVAIKTAKILAKKGYKVLVFDCDYNLSNTVIKLGLPIKNIFTHLINGDCNLEEYLYKDGGFHLLSANNGDLDLFDHDFKVDRFVLEILLKVERNYDFIILDCPAGLNREALTLNAYSDYRFIVVTPDKSSITDSYSLMKILNKKYGIKENHLLVNKISSNMQYKRIVKTLSETVENYLESRLRILGGIKKNDGAVDLFDKALFDQQNEIHRNFIKVINKFTEEIVEFYKGPGQKTQLYASVDDLEQDVQPSFS